jgi:hypothetical protein
LLLISGLYVGFLYVSVFGCGDVGELVGIFTLLPVKFYISMSNRTFLFGEIGGELLIGSSSINFYLRACEVFLMKLAANLIYSNFGSIFDFIKLVKLISFYI